MWEPPLGGQKEEALVGSPGINGKHPPQICCKRPKWGRRGNLGAFKTLRRWGKKQRVLIRKHLFFQKERSGAMEEICSPREDIKTLKILPEKWEHKET